MVLRLLSLSNRPSNIVGIYFERIIIVDRAEYIDITIIDLLVLAIAL